MIRRTIFSGALATLLFPQIGSATETLNQQLDRIVSEGINRKLYPGAVLVVGRPGEVLHAKAYGNYTYQPGAKPMSMNTLFDLASVSKVVGTATVSMKLVEEGRLSLETSVTKYIPEFTTGGKESVTVRDLLTHVSGLKSYDSATNAEKARKPDQTKAEALIQRIASLPASTAPRTKTTYSCLNMLTMASINEQILQTPMHDYLQRTIYRPAGMIDTTYRLTTEQLARTAPTILAKDGKPNTGQIHDPLANYYSDEKHCSGNAGLFSTAPDLSRYCTMILNEGQTENGRIFKPETIRMMTSLQSPAGISNLRGLGWDIEVKPPHCTRLNQTDETRVITHTGYTGTMIWVDKLSKSYFVFLTNRTLKDGEGESSASVTRPRAEIAQAVLRSRPEYQEYFATTGANDGKRDED